MCRDANLQRSKMCSLSLFEVVNTPMDQWILKIFLPGFRIQSKILTDFQIQQLQQIADSSSFWVGILDFAYNEDIFARISDSRQNCNGVLVNKL